MHGIAWKCVLRVIGFYKSVQWSRTACVRGALGARVQQTYARVRTEARRMLRRQSAKRRCVPRTDPWTVLAATLDIACLGLQLRAPSLAFQMFALAPVALRLWRPDLVLLYAKAMALWTVPHVRRALLYLLPSDWAVNHASVLNPCVFMWLSV